MNRVKEFKLDKEYISKFKDKRINNLKITKSTYKISIQLKHIRFLGKYDLLTHLPNSVYFFEKLNFVMKKNKINNKKGAIIYLDLDNYKVINDNFGYHVGNLILKSLSKLLYRCIGKRGHLSRLNGDEFVIILYEYNELEEIEKICEKIYSELKKPFKIINEEIYVTTSMGIALFPENSLNADELLKFCDFAIYKSKNIGKGTYTFFNQNALDSYYRKILIKNELKNAITRDEFDIFYQPQVDILNNEIIGMEALLRWNSYKLGSVSPAEFIPIAEDAGYIDKIGNWVMDTALKQVSIWKEEGYKFSNISINVSPIQMRKKEFKNTLLNYCVKYGIPPNLVEIEITEGTLIDACKENVQVLNELINKGISIAIDDFGTGYSSLSYLMNIPVNTLKIDKAFIDNIKNYKNKILIKNIVNLSKDLKYKIITEGVETLEQVKLLSELGCNIIQGFYFSKPLPKLQMENLLSNYDN
ncbi:MULTISPECIES: bifunctional diguanylate cyclase/phosphodiesterase [unclassified Clostridium]|uniref:putative bifunctional diguanylate cyclase/phosphodiesterase n=1 Tax=unclassified Clostridium TaxID=2614128 RepID=UPI000297E53A|nr:MULTISPECIES: bifunctional diguanylate cyclase/phosphodiesterase [unclassified Clostridium]EKQ51036.1 MAG: diguanylate cyclase (GGDEF) domain-containing protein [Clostridium sp. Maddingley MBC34-26]